MNIAIVLALILILTKSIVKAYDIRVMPLYKLRQLSFSHMAPVTNLATQLHSSVLQKQCFVNNILIECPPVYPMNYKTNFITNVEKDFQNVAETQQQEILNSDRTAQTTPNSEQTPPFRRMINQSLAPNTNMLPLHGKLDGYTPQKTKDLISASRSSKLNMKLDSLTIDKPSYHGLTTQPNKHLPETTETIVKDDSPRHSSEETLQDSEESTAIIAPHDVPISEKFALSLDHFERKFYATTFSKLTSISPAMRRENGMSYVQSGLFLLLALMALSTEVSPETRQEIDDCLGLNVSDQERIELINATVSSLPVSSEHLKFRWFSRLVLQSQTISDQFRTNAAPALQLHIDKFNGTETPTEMVASLNRMVEVDSGGAIHDTFDEDDLSEGVRAVLVTTLYLRARWRSAPTLLNGTRPFHDSENAPNRNARMIRVNDVMRYADLTDWDAEALEIFYSTPGLSLLMLVPRGNTLRRLADEVVNTSLKDITERMQPLRVAATLPLYTLRMTLLLSNKLEAMNISRLVDNNDVSHAEFRLSLAVQRIMFWAEAGRNAFKDDGLEWDEPPQRELVVDRPYIFYVRWKNNTLMNGNFVL